MAKLLSEDSAESDSELVESSQETNCCVCKKSEPEDGSEEFVFVGMLKWEKCDFCSHWTHLKTCTEVRVLRRDSEFRCPHCTL